MYGMRSFDCSLNIHVWNLSRNFWYTYHFIHETFDTRIILYTKLLIRVSFYTRNFWYAYRFIHETFDTRMFSNMKLFIRGTFGAFCPLWPTIHKGQWRGALMFSLICAWINVWVNNGEAGDLRRHCAHYDVIVMVTWNDVHQYFQYHVLSRAQSALRRKGCI